MFNQQDALAGRAIQPFAGLALLGALTFAGAGQAAYGADEARTVQAIAVGADDAAIPLRPLDDPANPFRNAYSDLDRYIYNNAWSVEYLLAFRAAGEALREQQKAQPPKPLTPGVQPPRDHARRYVAAGATPNGWLLPVELWGVSTEEMGALDSWPLGERLVDGPEVTSWPGSEHLQVFAGPNVPQAMYDEYERIKTRRLALRTPRIPDWLGQRPPLLTACLADGSFIAYGQQLAAPPPFDPGNVGNLVHWGVGRLPAGQPWLHLSADGQLLEQWPSNPYRFDADGWAERFWPLRKAVLAGANGRQRYGRSSDGTLVWVQYMPANPDSASLTGFSELEPAAAYRYDGQPLDLTAPLPAELEGRRQLGREALAEVWRAQQHYGVWLGNPGPQGDVDGALLSTQLKARLASLSAPEPVAPWAQTPEGAQVTLRSLEDPANPYRGLYTPFDRWMVAHWVAMDDPRARRNYAYGGPAIMSFGDVTAEGWVIPSDLNRNRQREQPATARALVEWRRPVAEKPQHYNFMAHGFMLPTADADGLKFSQLRQAQELPPIPGWLVARAVDAAVFVPNGDICCFTADERPEPGVHGGDGNGLTNRPGIWQRHSPLGELLGEYRSDEIAGGQWIGIYFPKWVELHRPHETRDGVDYTSQQVGIRGPYVLVSTVEGGLPNTGDDEYWRRPQLAVAVYDYDGTPLELDTPLPDRHGLTYGNAMDLDRLRELFECQLALGLTQ